MADVDQVAVVSQNMLWEKSGVGEIFPERIDCLVVQWFGIPSPLILCK